MSNEKFIEEALKAHNEYRSRHQVSPLTLNNDLSAHAQKWADNLMRTNSFQHSQCNYNGERVGENIAMQGSSGENSYTGEDATDQWYNEIKDYTFGVKTGNSGTGHFSQVVWKGSKELGVGVAQKGGTTIVVANYRPAGNMMGDYAKNVFPTSDGKVLIKEKNPEPSSASRFGDMRSDFFKDSSFPSQGSCSNKSESRSVRTFTSTETIGSKSVTKKITEETIIQADGKKVVNRTEEEISN